MVASEKKVTDEPVEPEKHMLNVLIKRWDELGYVLRQSPSIVGTPTKERITMAFICRLPNGEKDGTFKELYEALDKSEIGTNNPTQYNKKHWKDFNEVLADITEYCGRVYFKHFSYVKPRIKETVELGERPSA